MLHLACLLPGNALHWPIFDVFQSQLEISGEQDSEPSWGAQSRSRASGASVSRSPLSWEPSGHSTSAARFHPLYSCSTRPWGRSSFLCMSLSDYRRFPSQFWVTDQPRRATTSAGKAARADIAGGLAGIMGGHGSIRTRLGSNMGPDKRSRLRRGYPGGILVVQEWVPWPITPWAY